MKENGHLWPLKKIKTSQVQTVLTYSAGGGSHVHCTGTLLCFKNFTLKILISIGPPTVTVTGETKRF